MSVSIGAALATLFKEPIQKGGNILHDEFIHIFDSGLPEYIDSFYDKYSNTKTFIYRDEKVKFYDIFFPINISNRTDVFNTVDLKSLFEKKQFITIIGSAGSGKSMLMKHIFLSTVNNSFRIPIVIELRNLNDFNGNIYDYVSNILSKNEIAKTTKIIHRILKQGKFIFLFDGYDEIYSSSKDRITTDIEEFVDIYSKNIFVVTSRPGSNAESLQRFDNFYVQSLTSEQIESFTKLQFKNTEDADSVDKILSVIKSPSNKDYKDYLSSPLLLSMFIFTFKVYPELPKYKSKFYSNVFDTLCTKHDSFTKKGFWLHERKSGLQNEDLENILKWFSYVTFFKGKYNFDETYLKDTLKEIIQKLKLTCKIDDLVYDLTVSIAIIIQDGTEFTFPHKSLQEYFTAVLIKGLDEDQKEKIYHSKFDEQIKLSNGGNFNFYKLCFEVDKTHFCKYFLRPKTEKFIDDVYSRSPIKLTFNLLEIFNIEFYESIAEKKTIQSYSTNTIMVEAFLDFFDIDLEEYIPSFEILIENSNILKQTFKNVTIRTSKYSKNEEFYLDFKNPTEKSRKEIVEFLQVIGLVKKSVELIDKVKLGLTELLKDVNEEKENTKDLLDI